MLCRNLDRASLQPHHSLAPAVFMQFEPCPADTEGSQLGLAVLVRDGVGSALTLWVVLDNPALEITLAAHGHLQASTTSEIY